jgi:hypothetical protein
VDTSAPGRLFTPHPVNPVMLTTFLCRPTRPYVKGLPITATILSSHPNGDHSEEVIRREFVSAGDRGGDIAESC